MKLLFFFVILVTTLQTSSAQIILKGQIKDKNTQINLQGATIYVVEANKGTSSDESGNYSISGLGKGSYKIQVSYLGYETVIEETQISNTSETILNFELIKKSFEINEVVVSSPYILSQEKNTFKIDLIDKNEMQKKGAFTVMDIINKTPGVDAITTGSIVSRPVIRGLSGNRVLTVVDGIRFETQQWDDEHGIGVNELGIDKIEIIKGPASLLYGAEAMGGVINFIKSKPVDVGTIRGNALAAIYTNNLGARVNADINGANENLNWGINISSKLLSDYFFNGYDFRVPNTRLLENGFKTYAGINKKWGSSTLTFTNNKAFYGILDAKDIVIDEQGQITNVDVGEKEKFPFEVEAPFHEVTDYRINSKTTVLFGDSKLETVLEYQNNKRAENEEQTGSKKGYRYLDMNLQSYNYDVKWYLPTWKKFKTIVGSQGMHQTNKNTSKAATQIIPDATINDLGFLAVTKLDLDKIILSFGTRYDVRNLSTQYYSANNSNIDAISRSYNNLSSSIGSSFYLAKDLQLKVNYASGYRAPNLNELTSNGVKLESQHYEIGNSNFKKEQNHQFDFNVNYSKKNFSVDASVFWNTINNFIYIAPTGNQVASNIDPTITLEAYQFYQSDATIRGGELSFNIHPSSIKWAHFETKASSLIGKRSDDDSYLPMMPTTKFTNTLYFSFDKVLNLKDVFINLGTMTALKQDKVATNEMKTPSYTLVNFAIGTKIKKSEITLTANNLFDKKYLNNMSRLRSFGIYEPGMNISLSVKVPIDIK
ncbi:TonB-dependent receptor domain-containing protein [Flavobacterium ponti]|uniref:TonB-dependent receptor domain-containing protein n=1 Tax=Flavobacterium ponti TaxID=665133 RepID=A0ABV9P4Y4_9FLAO